MPKIKINDISMYYEIHGQGEPIILITGFGADHTMWLEITEKLKQQYQVILFDNRGAGQTDIPEGSYSIEQMADDLQNLCVNLKISKAHFVGNSMGGFILQTLAYKYPQLVKSAIISNSVAKAYSPFHIYAQAQYELRKANAPLESIIKASCSWIFSYQFLNRPGMLSALIQNTLNNPYLFTLTGYQGQLAALEKFDSSHWVEKIIAPTLIMSGDQDLIFNKNFVKELSEKIPHAKYYCFENCGHLPFVEYPEIFTKNIMGFLSNNSF